LQNYTFQSTHRTFYYINFIAQLVFQYFNLAFSYLFELFGDAFCENLSLLIIYRRWLLLSMKAIKHFVTFFIIVRFDHLMLSFIYKHQGPIIQDSYYSGHINTIISKISYFLLEKMKEFFPCCF
jgi:hypothetical protein